MGRLAATFQRAVAAHREALAHLTAAREATGGGPLPAPPARVRDIAERLTGIAAAVAPGWQGGPLREPRPYGSVSPHAPVPLRLGTGHPGEQASFPVLVPLLGGVHLALDADARDPRVATLLRGLVIRILGATRAGSVRVSALDRATLGATFLPLRPLVDSGVMAPTATDEDGLRHLLEDAERHTRAAQSDPDHEAWLLVVAASAPEHPAELARLAALTHAGPAARVCLVLAGYRPQPAGLDLPPLGATTRVRVQDRYVWIGDPPGEAFGTRGERLAVPVTLDGDPPPSSVVAALAAHLGEQHRRASALTFTDLIPARHWTESSAQGLRTVVGRCAGRDMTLGFTDATPHWLVGGRTGAGKTVFLLDVLYGLATRYSPDELALYLLDFKEGVSFTEFVPTGRDPSWIPHARVVGIESDREYGVAVLRELRREMDRRAAVLKRFGVTKLSDLRGRGQDDVALPRVVVVIDEFHVLLAGNDPLARKATALLEELARKGRSYGLHLALASQTVSGVEALYGKSDSIFGQFPVRVALPGGSGVLGAGNDAAADLPLGQAVVNTAAGLVSGNAVLTFPDAHAGAGEVAALRRSLWEARTPGSQPPTVFRGYDAARVEDDPTFRSLAPDGRPALALVGRAVDVGLSTALFPLDAVPGRHLAVVGTSPVGADVLHAATVGLARQHPPGAARFLVAPLAVAGDEVADETMAALRSAGHPVTALDIPGLRDELRELASPEPAPPERRVYRTYLVVFGVDAASAALGLRDPATFRSGMDDLQAVLRQGPGYGVHLLGWWRGLRRLADDIGGSGNREDVACLVALNVPGPELGLFLGQHDLSYSPRPNRALLVDRHDQRVLLVVPFVRPGRVVEEVG